MSPSQINAHAHAQSFSAASNHGSRSVVSESNDLNGFSIDATQEDLAHPVSSHNLMDASEFPDFSFSYQDLAKDSQMMGLDDHGVDLFANSGGASISSMGAARQDSVTSGAHNANFALANDHSIRPQSVDGSENGSPDSNHQGGNSLEDNMSDEFGLSGNAPGDGTDLGAKLRDNKSEDTPAWSELKTKAGKERKRLPLACIACRRKKIRCSGEKPACKHCLRSRIPCVYKVTTRKAAPRTDYMAMLDKRLKRMEDRIIKIVPKSEQDSAPPTVIRAQVKPQLPGSIPAGKQNSKKRVADEAFSAELDHWARGPPKSRSGDADRPTSVQVQEGEDGKLLGEGREALPPMDIQEHLAEVFFENIYGQAYHLLHKPSYMRKLKYVNHWITPSQLTMTDVLLQSRCLTSGLGPLCVRHRCALFESSYVCEYAAFHARRAMGSTRPRYCHEAIRVAQHNHSNVSACSWSARVRHVPRREELVPGRPGHPNGVCIATAQRSGVRSDENQPDHSA